MMKPDANLLNVDNLVDMNILTFLRKLPGMLGVPGMNNRDDESRNTNLFGTTAPSTSMTVSGDPHFVGLAGQRYDVMGESDRFYNIISCGNLQFNAYFLRVNLESEKDNTFIMGCGIKVGTPETGIKRILFNSNHVKINGINIPEVKKTLFYRKFDAGIRDENGDVVEGHIIYKSGFHAKHRVLEVCSGAILIKLWWQHWHYPELVFPAISMFVQVKPIGVLSDGIMPHGLLGQTARSDVRGFSGVGENKQGEGVIEGNYKDYEVSSWFSDDFKYNKFGTKAIQKPVFGYIPFSKSPCMVF